MSDDIEYQECQVCEFTSSSNKWYFVKDIQNPENLNRMFLCEDCKGKVERGDI